MLLQPHRGPIDGDHYVPTTPDTSLWGWLPNRDTPPALRVGSGATVTFDATSHEGLLEDQGRDPRGYFRAHGIATDEVLTDAVDIAASGLEHDFDDGPHVVSAPVAVDGAEPGDVLRIDVLSLRLRTGYGVISNRHGYGALAGEFPEDSRRHDDAGIDAPERYGSRCHVTHVEQQAGRMVGLLPYGDGAVARFPLAPFLGIMGVAPDTADLVPSVPPGRHGGNIDVNELQVGSSLYLPVQVPGASFYVGDPHWAQGDGEVALTALEAPLRATVRLTRLPASEAGTLPDLLADPLIETATHWVPTGLHEDLDEAMRRATRHAVAHLERVVGMDRATALAYLSAAADFEVSQVVDGVKGVHCMIRRADFAA
ncbi:acetamidase [Nitriliruptoraceae bacterium ZYF776]|nr:acetamidase [Profundirhabdus halotolerans]